MLVQEITHLQRNIPNLYSFSAGSKTIRNAHSQLFRLPFPSFSDIFGTTMKKFTPSPSHLSLCHCSSYTNSNTPYASRKLPGRVVLLLDLEGNTETLIINGSIAVFCWVIGFGCPILARGSEAPDPWCYSSNL